MTDRLEIENDPTVEGVARDATPKLPEPVTIDQMYLAAILAAISNDLTYAMQNFVYELQLIQQSNDRLCDLLEQALRKPGK